MADVLQIKLETTGDGKVKASLAGVSKELDGVEDNAAGASAAMKTVAAAAVAIVGSQIAQYIYNVNSRFDNLDARLRVATGSAEGAQVAMAGLEEHFAGLPITVEETAGAFIRLKNLGLDPSKAAIESYANTAAAMGTDLTQFIEAVADASVMEFERLKEFGIKAAQQGDQVTFTFQGVKTTVQKDAAQIEQYLQNIGNVNFAGSLEAQADTLGGATKMMVGEVDRMVRAMTGGDLNDLLIDAAGGVATLSREITAFINDPSSLPEWAKVTAFAMHELWQGFEGLAVNIGVIGASIAAALSGEFGLIDDIWDEGRAKFEAMERETTEFVARLEGLRPAGGGEQQDRPKGSVVFERPERTGSGAAGGGGSIAQTTAELDDMDRAMDLIIQQFEDLDEAEARAIAGLSEMGTAGTQAADEVQAAFVEILTQSERMWKGMADASEGWANSFGDALAEMATTGKADFGELAESIIKDIIRLWIQMQVIEPLMNGMQGYFNHQSVGGVEGDAYMPAAQSRPVGNRATGGPVYGGQTYLVGERGPELLTMGGNGMVTPNNQLGGGAPPSMPVRVIIHNEGGQPKQAEAQTDFDAEGAVVRVFLRDVDSNGPMSSAMAGKFGLRQRVG